MLRCIDIPDQIFQGKRKGALHYLEALRKNEVPGLLYLILFIHDLGKIADPKAIVKEALNWENPYKGWVFPRKCTIVYSLSLGTI